MNTRCIIHSLPVGLGGLLRLGTRICRAGMIYRRSVGFGS